MILWILFLICFVLTLCVLSQVANWRMEKLEMDSKSGSEEEFFDCLGKSKYLV